MKSVLMNIGGFAYQGKKRSDSSTSFCRSSDSLDSCFYHAKRMENYGVIRMFRIASTCAIRKIKYHMCAVVREMNPSLFEALLHTSSATPILVFSSTTD